MQNNRKNSALEPHKLTLKNSHCFRTSPYTMAGTGDGGFSITTLVTDTTPSSDIMSGSLSPKGGLSGRAGRGSPL